MDRSARLMERAMHRLPGGVNSPVRAFRSVGGDPLFMRRGEGSRIFDVDGNSYVDYVMSYGPLILGHTHPEVVKALERAVRDGTTFGGPTELEVELAELVCEVVPSVEMVRMTNSGTEATMSAIRVARGYTGRDGILKFDGNYHGHGDALLVAAGSGVATLGLPDSPRATEGAATDTPHLPHNTHAPRRPPPAPRPPPPPTAPASPKGRRRTPQSSRTTTSTPCASSSGARARGS